MTLALTMVVLAGLVAACGSDDDDSATTASTAQTNSPPLTSASTGAVPEATAAGGTAAQSTATEGTDTANSSPITEGDSLADMLSGDVSFPVASGPFEMPKARVAIINLSNSTTGDLSVNKLVTEAVEAAGWDAPPVYDGQFSPSVQAGLVQQAVLDKVD